MFHILSQDKKTVVTEADYFDIQCCNSTSLSPTIYFHKGVLTKGIGTYSSQEDAQRVLEAITQPWNMKITVTYMPQDDQNEIDDFCSEPRRAGFSMGGMSGIGGMGLSSDPIIIPIVN